MEINLEESRQVVQMARAKAIQLNMNANIAILDTAGQFATNLPQTFGLFLKITTIAINKKILQINDLQDLSIF